MADCLFLRIKLDLTRLDVVEGPVQCENIIRTRVTLQLPSCRGINNPPPSSMKIGADLIESHDTRGKVVFVLPITEPF